MKIEKLVVGQLQTNCYLVWDKKSDQAIIIDPGDAADFIINKIRDLALKPKLIVATHGHFDHLLAVTELKLALGIPFLIHQKDEFLVKDIKARAKYWLQTEWLDPAPKVDQFIKEGDWLEFGQEKLRVIETPGHSPGGVSLYQKGVLFSGDTLFFQGIGRHDFAYASATKLFASLKKLFKLPGKTKVYPGHGPETTLEKEKEFLGNLKNQEF